MSAYVISRVNAKNWSWLKEYGAPTRALVEKYGGRYLVQGGNTHSFEGGDSLPAAIVVLEFPDMDAARAWYDDPEYQPLKAIRQANAEVELTLIEGLG